MFYFYGFSFFIFWFFGVFMVSYNYLRLLGFFYFGVFFLGSLIAFLLFHKGLFWYQLIFNFFTLTFLNSSYIMSMDGVSVFMIVLCAFLLFLCLLYF